MSRTQSSQSTKDTYHLTSSVALSLQSDTQQVPANLDPRLWGFFFAYQIVFVLLLLNAQAEIKHSHWRIQFK